MSKRKNPETSKAAYKSLDPDHLNDTYKNILYGLSKLREATYEELAKFLKESPSKIWKRLSELNKMELIYRPGNKRKLKSGREGFTWCLTGKVPEHLQQRERALGGESLADHSRKITTIVREHERKTKKPQQPEYTNKLF